MTFIPPHAYFDQDIFDREMEVIFDSVPRYIGHEKLVPNVGDFYTLKNEHEGRMLIHTQDGIKLMSNICRHRQGIIQRGKGTTNHITCPLHKWSWKISGEMQAAPYFSQSPCKNLRTWDIQNWRGLLFEGGDSIVSTLTDVGFTDEINFQDYIYHRTEYHECNYNWKTFMEVFGDDYHVIPFHPGLSQMVSLETLDVIEGNAWHIQSVRSSNKMSNRTTPIYENWRNKCLRQGGGKMPPYGAIWMGYYPNIMVEVYPYTITISTLDPISPQKTINTVEFFYHKDVPTDLVESQEEAYMETVREDDELAQCIDGGRYALMHQSNRYTLPDDELTGLFHAPMESGTKHFHAWYMSRMNY